MTALDIPAQLANALISSGISGSVLILLILGCMLLLGAFMDCGAAMAIIVPLVYPILVSYGLDPYTSICLLYTSRCV